MPKLRRRSRSHDLKVTAQDAIQLATRMSNGVLHIGAHRGQESALYAKFGKPVIWFEAIPEVAKDLSERLRGVRSQVVHQVCLAESDDEEIEFHISSNDGQSSSILPFGSEVTGKRGAFRNLGLRTTSRLALKTRSLDSFMHEIGAPAHQFNHWVVDVQGAELLVLKGARQSLQECRSLLVETSTIDLYDGGSSFADVNEFLSSHGFRALWRCQGHMDVLFLRDPR